MSRRPIERVHDLLAKRATQALAAAERDEMDALLADHPEVDTEAFDLAAAAAYLELASQDDLTKPERMPRHLELRLVEEGQALVGDLRRRRGNVTPFPSAARSKPSMMGWWAAAACLALAVTGWWPRIATTTAPALPAAATIEETPIRDTTSPQDVSLTAAQLRRQLLEDAADARVIAWTSTEDAAAENADGDVVWSTNRQQGYMRIRRLEANDVSATQYQLWIFDAARDERYPVDGGVFDVPADVEEIVVPIDAKVFVNEPALFAVTVEPPGGVVVSDRERIVLVAQV